jgi:hypothetical protein
VTRRVAGTISRIKSQFRNMSREVEEMKIVRACEAVVGVDRAVGVMG